jgi:1-acylglycerone phosphate reductase
MGLSSFLFRYLVILTLTKGEIGLYAASKRSLSETLRLELLPFGVNVLSVVTGAVQSEGQTYFQDWKLPEGSIYKPTESLIAERTRGNDGHGRIDRTQYADYFVEEVIGGKGGKIWQGTNASAERFGSSDLAQSMMVSFLVIETAGRNYADLVHVG